MKTIAIAMLAYAGFVSAPVQHRPLEIRRTWYANGQLRDERSYAGGREQGVHRGWWEDGSRRFEAYYDDARREGEMREWNEHGMLFHLGHYVNGAEAGVQQMWNEDGSLRANYVVKNGRRYGYMGAVGCTGGNADADSTSAR